MTPPHSKPPPDVLTRLITRLERQLARRRNPAETQAAGAQHPARPPRDLDAYLAHRIDKALAPLRPLLDENDISFLRAMLRERIASDPTLTRLVQRLARAKETDST